MRSKANLKSHPIHPILVAFPIAFFIGTFLFDTLGAITGNEAFTTTGRYLNVAGIAGALLAAVPGVIDYFFTVPPKSSAAKRAVKHGLINVTVLLLFVCILVYRQSAAPIAGVIIGAEVAGIALLSIAGWMGGTLVHRNQIGVDIRYAHAGKWKEDYVAGTGRVKVATVDELKTNQMKLVHLEGRRIVIGKTEDGYVAFDDHCTHRGGSLAAGAMVCGTVQCPWHGSQFDCKTGAVQAGPATAPIRTYDLQQEGNDLYLNSSVTV